MTDSGEEPDPTGRGREAVRIEATVHIRPGAAVTASAVEQRVSALDLDRVRDATGEVRVLLTPDDVTRLTAQGFEVRVQQSMPVQPLDAGLVADDAAVQHWFDSTVRGE